MSTGSQELDRVLGGGLTAGSLLVLAGEPGTGKTVLAQQLAFANATGDGAVRYYTTLSEAHAKLMRHLSGFSFFDQEAVGRRIHYLHLTEFAQRARDEGRGLAAIIDEIVRSTFQHEPSIVVVDSSKALRQFAEPGELREGVFELASKMGHTGALLVFVGEYTVQDFADAPEFAVADAIIHLVNERQGPADRRWLRVVKLRGRDHLPGQHTFEITSEGYRVYPRLETTAPVRTSIGDGRTTFGLPEIDVMTGGGIPRGDTALLFGPTGAGKTTLGVRFVAQGLSQGERALYISLEESEDELLARSARFELGFREAVDDGRLRLVQVPSTEVQLDRLGGLVRDIIAEHDPTRVVIDPLSGLTHPSREQGRFPSYPAALAATATERGATLIFTFEVQALGGPGAVYEVSQLAHDVLVLRYMERGSELGRVFSVLKMRRSDHDKGLLQYEITSEGLRTVGQAGDVQHITGWTVLGAPTGSA